MKLLSSLLLLQFLVLSSWAQYNLSGIVENESGEPLIGANVVIRGTYQGVTTDTNGSFSFTTLKPDTYELQVSYIGYEDVIKQVNVADHQTIHVTLEQDYIMAEEVLVSANRAGNKTPVAFSTVESDEIKSNNLGQDIPYLLGMTSSFVATSDAGSGVGYTNFRIRGTDLTRINVTINGIPLNDAESHGTWWVDVPDMASSTDNIQVQRGVGTSTNGAAAFGASINVQTMNINREPYTEYNSSAGSFSTYKNSIAVGTGLINENLSFDLRLSKISSEGFIDRAASDLKSFYASANYSTENTILKAIAFSGFEETYQAWNGVPSVRLNNDYEGMQRYADHWLYSQQEVDEMVNSDSRTYNIYTYENQVDHYQQDHYQLLYTHKFNPALNMNAALFYTYGRGYYEEYKEDRDFADYLMEAPVIGGTVIESTDLIRRKWLDNDFYGANLSMNYNKNASDFTLGGAYSVYDGDHFGKVIWAKYYGETELNHEWYRGAGLKKDFNIFTKYNYQVNENLNLFADLQYRHIDYEITGNDDDLRDLTQSHTFDFFNPKLGIYYTPNERSDLYISYSQAHKEPTRSNYVDANPAAEKPQQETLNDFELGYKYKTGKLFIGANLYYMLYKDQLILTGEINDVGAPIMTNTEDSHRSGIELSVGWKIIKSLTWEANATFSSNKIKNFTEYVDNWDTWGQEAYELGKTDLAFSPSLIVNSRLRFSPSDKISISLQSSYVSDQYIDNTSSDDRKLDAYFIHNLKLDYQLKQNLFDELTFHLMINNLFDAKYENNAWVYSYIYDDQRNKMDGYFPQAGIHFLAGVHIKF